MMQRFITRVLLAFFLWTSSTTLLVIAAEPLHVGSAKQVFIDGRFIERKQGANLVVNRPQLPREKLIVPEHPWEEFWIGGYFSVIQDEDRIHMWYETYDPQGLDALAYAYSTDGGSHWIKPKLGIIDYHGSKANNLVMKGIHGPHLFRNRPDAPTDEKYCMFTANNRAFVSADDHHWKPKGKVPFLDMGGQFGLDSQNVIFWDTRLKKYTAFPRLGLPGLMRTVGRTVSPTFGNFPVPRVVFSRDDLDPPDMDFYTSATIQYPYAADAYYMFPAAYHHYHSPPSPPNDGPLDIQFAASRDGIKWQRPDRRPIIRRGRDGDWDDGGLYVGYGISRQGDELSLYYAAYDITHGDYDEKSRRKGVISRAIYRLDGFMSVDADYSGGEFTPPPLVFDSDRLIVNFDGSAGGWIKVEILDTEGKPLKGFDEKVADRLDGNSTAMTVTWRGKPDVSSLKGRPVKLRFVMRDGKLFSLQFSKSEKPKRQ